MTDFNEGKIYKIVTEQSNKCYVGSTCDTLIVRMNNHKTDYNCWLNGGTHFVTSFEILKYDDAKIELIELYPCETKRDLLQREGHYQRLLDCVNKCIAGRTKTQYYEDNKTIISDKRKQWRNNNKKHYSEQRKKSDKKYYENKKYEIRDKQTMYYDNNKEHIKRKTTQYYENNKQEIANKRGQKVICDCGILITKGNISTHKKSNRHIKLMEAL